MISIVDETGIYEFPAYGVWLIAAAVLLFYVGFYLLRSFGLYKIAKRENVKYSWLAFIPVGWIYLLANIIGDVIFFGRKFRGFNVIMLVVGIINAALTITTTIMTYLPLVGYYLQGGEVIISYVEGFAGGTEYWTGGIYTNGLLYPYPNVDAAANAINVMNYISYVIDIIYVVGTVTLFINFFKYYLPQYALVATIFSAFGFFGPFAFAVRKNSRFNYADYARRRYNAYYNQNNQNNNNAQGGSPNGSPFEDFAEKGDKQPEDPFSEFDNKDN